MPCNIERSLLRPAALQNRQVDRAVEIIKSASQSRGRIIVALAYHNDQISARYPCYLRKMRASVDGGATSHNFQTMEAPP